MVARAEPEARLDLLTRAPGLAVRDPERIFLAAVRTRLRSDHDEETTAAVNALMHRQDEADVAAFAETVAALFEDPRSLTVATTALTAYDAWARDSWKRAFAALEEVLDRPGWQPLRLRAAKHRDVEGLSSLALELADRRQLDRETVEALRALLAPRVSELSDLALRLRSHADEEARLLALWLVTTDAATRGWSAERIAHLAVLRADPSPVVAGAAKRIFPPREKER